MATTNNLAITLVEQSQAQKEVTVNAALTRIDAILNASAIDKDVATPPGSPSAGDVYIVAASATGDWSGEDGNLAYFDQVWKFIAPQEGMKIWVGDEDCFYVYFASAWHAEGDYSRLFTKAQVFAIQVLTDATTIDWDVRAQQVASVTLAGNRTLANPSNAVAGGTYILVVTQDATGSRTLAFSSDYRFADGSAPTLSTSAGAVDVLSFIYDGTHMLGVAQLDFS